MDQTIMNELEIAEAEAEILDRMSNWGRHISTSNDSSYDPRTRGTKLDPDMERLAKLETRKYELAKYRARESNRNFEVVLAETQLQILFQLGRILAKSIDPVVAGTRDVVVDQDGEVCGVCQEEMGKGEEATAMDCNHKFHWQCIAKWLEQKRTCPLCRCVMQVRKYEF